MKASNTHPSYYAQAREDIQPFIPSASKKILDIGCAEGVLGSVLKKKFSSEVWGMEMVPEAAAQAATRLDRVIVGNVCEQLDLIPDRHFDCILMNDVLEHLVHPEKLLQSVKAKLSPQGVVVASIPNIRYFFVLWDLVMRKNWNYADSGVLDRTHLRFFTEKSIKKFFLEHHYAILRMEGINPIRDWRVRLINLFSFGFFKDALFQQYAVVAKPRSE